MLLSQLPSVLEAAGIGREDIKKLDSLYEMAASVSGGLQKQFVEELSLLASILDQRAIVHHLEPSYFRSLTAMVEAIEERRQT